MVDMDMVDMDMVDMDMVATPVPAASQQLPVFRQ